MEYWSENLPSYSDAGSDLGGRRLEDERDAGPRNRHEDVLDLLGPERPPGGRLGRRPERAVHEVAGGIGLVRDPRRLPAGAEVGELRLDVDVALLGAEEGVVEAELALDHRGRALRTERREPRRDQRRRAPPRPGGAASSRFPPRGRRRSRRPSSPPGRRRRPRCPRRGRSASPRRRSRRRSRRSRSGWKPRLWNWLDAAMPMRVRRLVGGDDRGRGRRGPIAPRASATASVAGQVTVEMWLTESEWVSSKSRPWQSIAFAKAAFGAGRPPSRPMTVACASPPSSPIAVRPSVATPRACAARPQPIVSSRWSFAASTTSSGMSSNPSAVVNSVKLSCSGRHRHTVQSSSVPETCRAPRARRACRP